MGLLVTKKKANISSCIKTLILVGIRISTNNINYWCPRVLIILILLVINNNVVSVWLRVYAYSIPTGIPKSIITNIRTLSKQRITALY